MGYKITETITRERVRFTRDEERAQELDGLRYVERDGTVHAVTVEECPHHCGSGYLASNARTTRGRVTEMLIMECDDCGDEMYRELRWWTYAVPSGRWYGSPDGMILVQACERFYPDGMVTFDSDSPKLANI